jgi:citrate lyase subunit beta/citryl-CoA lyase
MVVTPLFVPANRPERFAKAAGSGADAIIIDLEDAVAPADKAGARDAFVGAALPAGVAVFLRINPSHTEFHEDDLAAARGKKLAGVMLPKAESPVEIQRIAAGAGLKVIALIETARGIAAARDIARTPGVARLAFGSIDFCADIGAAHMRDALLAARSEIVLAARLGGLDAPLDGVTTAIDDAALVEDDARYAASLGFGGKLCIHPRQIAAALLGFAPTAAEIDWARRILAAGPGAVSIDGAMVDAPVQARARRILQRAGLE